MDDVRLGQLCRAARIRRGWRQIDLAARAIVSQAAVSRVERGMASTCRLADLRAIATTLEVQLDLQARWRGGEGARLIAARHSAMAEEASVRLPRWGWVVHPEVSFSIWGERGVIDLLAWHPVHQALLVIELKTELLDVGEILGTLDRKRRLAPVIARQFGWEATAASSCVLLHEDRTNHRHLARHAAVLRAALPSDGRVLRGWLARPSGTIHALAFLTDSSPVTTRPGSKGCRRVRPPRSRIVERGADQGRGRRAAVERETGAHQRREPA